MVGFGNWGGGLRRVVRVDVACACVVLEHQRQRGWTRSGAGEPPRPCDTASSAISSFKRFRGAGLSGIWRALVGLARWDAEGVEPGELAYRESDVLESSDSRRRKWNDEKER